MKRTFIKIYSEPPNKKERGGRAKHKSIQNDIVAFTKELLRHLQIHEI